jgi:uncharacterized protein (TIGR02145 family)
MNKIFSIVASAALVFGMFTACGDDSSSSSWEPSDDEEISSSSEKTKKSSSSEEKKSSSSKKSESSSSGEDEESSSSSEDVKSSSSSEDGSSSSWSELPQKKLVQELGACNASNADSLAEYDIWYVCLDGQWKPAEPIVEEWAAGNKDGDSKFGGENRCYVYDEAQGWYYTKKTDCTLGLLGCTLKNRGVVDKGSDKEWYVCKVWQLPSDTTKYGHDWTKVPVDLIELGSCTDANKDSMVVLNSQNYICKDYEWTPVSRVDIDTKGMKCTEKEKGTISKGVDTEYEYYCTGTKWVEYTAWSWDVPLNLRLNKDFAYDSIVDSRDKQVYKTVKIGSQTWMAQNLNYADSSKTPSLKGRSWCYNYKSEYCKVGGRFYTWAAAIDSVALATAEENPQACGRDVDSCKIPEGNLRGICPEGWHLPSIAEWETLKKVTESEGENASLRSITGWDFGANDNGTDDYGFTALPAGFREHVTASSFQFKYSGRTAFFWSAAEAKDENKSTQAQIFLFDGKDASIYVSYKEQGLSVRCVKD